MKFLATTAAALTILGLCRAESSSITPPAVAETAAVALPKKARKKVKPPKSLNPIKIGDISSNSVLGRKLMEKARRVQYNNYNGNQYGGYNNYNKNNGNYAYNANANGNYYANQKYNQAQYNNNNNNAGQQYYGNYNNNGNNNYWNQYGFEQWFVTQSQWLKDFSVKFQGCHHITEWNKDAQDAEDIRVKLRRLVRFKMCPTAYCNAASEEGCQDGYGEYVIDLETFLEGYVEAKEEYDENMQQYENYNQGQYYQNGYQNGYYQYQQNANDDEGIDISDYLECQQLDIDYQDENYGNQNEDEDWDGNYYIGPTCGEQGGEIHLGVFKDDECTIAAESDNGARIYYAATGYTLPFSQSNMIELDCVPCSEVDISDDDDADNNENDSEVSDWCESLYMIAGKCEENLPYGTSVNPNNQACNFVEGVKVLRQDGTILTTNRSAPGSVSRGNKIAATFIGLFTGATALLVAYTYYLKTKLDRASIALLE